VLDSLTNKRLIVKAFSLIHFYLSLILGFIPKGTIISQDPKIISNDIEIISDIDRNKYHVRMIGTQTWMLENLKVTRFNDAIEIPFNQELRNHEWLKTPSYYLYNDLDSFKTEYGVLYNWHVVASNKLCPLGWHVPTIADWEILEVYIQQQTKDKDKYSDLGQNIWKRHEGEAQDTFLYLKPGGIRLVESEYMYIGRCGFWWTSAEYNADKAYIKILNSPYASRKFMREKVVGASVLCIQD